MSHTFIMRLAGPMQSWGVSSRFGIRETLSEPSKSGVIGLLCAALGWDRTAQTHLIAGNIRTLADLSALRFGVRVVREGVVRRDYHTAQNVLRAKAKLRPGKPVSDSDLQETVLSERYYLSDAYFLVGFESDDVALLHALDEALSKPYWPLCLGRKAFPPSLPVRYTTELSQNVLNQPLADALLIAQDPLLTRQVYASATHSSTEKVYENTRTIRLVIDGVADADTLDTAGLVMARKAQRTDVPLSFEPRRFAPREVSIYTAIDHVSV